MKAPEFLTRPPARWPWIAASGVLAIAALLLALEVRSEYQRRQTLRALIEQRASRPGIPADSAERAERLRQLDRQAQTWLAARTLKLDALLLGVERLQVKGVQVETLQIHGVEGWAELRLSTTGLAEAEQAIEQLNAGLNEGDARWHWIGAQAAVAGAGSEAKYSVTLRWP